MLDEVAGAMRTITAMDQTPRSAEAAGRLRKIQELREQCLKAELPWTERGAILTLLGSAERAFYLIERVAAERQSVRRPAMIEQEQPEAAAGMEPVPMPAG
jgi:phosphate:Na+ symporter